MVPRSHSRAARSLFLAQKHYEPSFPYGPCYWSRQRGQARFTHLLFNNEKYIIYLLEVLDYISLWESVEEMYYEDEIRVRKMAFGSSLQLRVEERLRMDESFNSARVLVDLLSKLEVSESALHGKNLMVVFVKEHAW